MPILVDSNVLLDVLTRNPAWEEWSSKQIDTYSIDEQLCINPIIYAEISYGFTKIELVDDAFPERVFKRLEIPYEASFLAAKAHERHRERGGSRSKTLPDFYIGAHAAVEGLKLLTRDASRYRTYFPTIQLITPDK